MTTAYSPMASLRAMARPIPRDPPVTIATGVLEVLRAFVITRRTLAAITRGRIRASPGVAALASRTRSRLGLGLRDGRPAPAGVSGPVRGARCARPAARDCPRGQSAVLLIRGEAGIGK